MAAVEPLIFSPPEAFSFIATEFEKLLHRVSSNLENLEIRENGVTQGNHGKLRENDKDSGKVMNIAALS